MSHVRQPLVKKDEEPGKTNIRAEVIPALKGFQSTLTGLVQMDNHLKEMDPSLPARYGQPVICNQYCFLYLPLPLPQVLNDDTVEKVRRLVGDNTIPAHVGTLRARVADEIKQLTEKVNFLKDANSIGMRFFKTVTDVQSRISQFNSSDMRKIVYDYLGADALSVELVDEPPQPKPGLLSRFRRR